MQTVQSITLYLPHMTQRRNTKVTSEKPISGSNLQILGSRSRVEELNSLQYVEQQSKEHTLNKTVQRLLSQRLNFTNSIHYWCF